ncbi:hypothetical protein EV361DRAFT_871221 [Lentinula raphanica]|nr:hypothetical protein EV361DRAFT_871221 [Lentinula raphanica]
MALVAICYNVHMACATSMCTIESELRGYGQKRSRLVKTRAGGIAEKISGHKCRIDNELKNTKKLEKIIDYRIPTIFSILENILKSLPPVTLITNSTFSSSFAGQRLFFCFNLLSAGHLYFAGQSLNFFVHGSVLSDSIIFVTVIALVVTMYASAAPLDNSPGQEKGKLGQLRLQPARPRGNYLTFSPSGSLLDYDPKHMKLHFPGALPDNLEVYLRDIFVKDIKEVAPHLNLLVEDGDLPL